LKPAARKGAGIPAHWKDQKEFGDLASPGGRVDHVSIYYNAGHPGVPVPHYHIVLWHVSKAQESLVAK
jgi:hypothetical protein